MMTPEELSILSDTISGALKPYIDDLVQAAINEIPYTIRRELNAMVDTEVRRLVRQTVADNVSVELRLKHE